MLKFLAPAVIYSIAACGAFTKKDQTDEGPENKDGPPLVIFGDSVASGMFADTTMGDTASNEKARQFTELAHLRSTSDTESVDYFKAVQKVSAKPEKTAFAGRESYSFANRLASLTGRQYAVWNFAVPGTTTETMQEQIPRAKASAAFAADKEPLIVLHIGANDFCDRRLTEFRSSYAARLREIIKLHPKSKIMTVMIPNIPEVLRFEDKTAFKLPGRSLSCSQMRKELGFCKKVAINNGMSSADVAVFAQELSAMNNAIKDETALAAKDLKFENRLAYASYDFAGLSDQHLAIDCFHPSSAGHERLAAFTWETFKNFAL